MSAASSTAAGQAQTPAFVGNLVAIGSRALTLQARKVNQVALKQNLVENVGKIFGNKLKWSEFVVEHMKEEHSVIREKVVKAKQAFQDSYDGLLKGATADQDAATFFANFLAGLRLFASKCCFVHETARYAYVECVETDLKLMTRSLLLCRESMSSKNMLVEKFELATVVIARLAETCSLVAAQSTTSEQTSKSLNGHFDHLNDLNELLANRINVYITSPSESEKEHGFAVIRTIQELESIVEEIFVMMNEERALIRRQDFFTEFTKQLDATVIHKEIQAEAHLGEIEHIRERGAVKRLEMLEAKTGQKTPEALQKLAVETDTLGETIENIYYAMSDSDAMDLRSVVAEAPNVIKQMAEEAQKVIREEVGKQTAATKQAKTGLTSETTELDTLSKEVQDLAKGQVKAEAIVTRRKSLNTIINRSLSHLDPKTELLLGLGDAQKTSKLKSQLKDRINVQDVFSADKSDKAAQEEARRLSKAVDDVRHDLTEYTAGLDQDAARNQKMLADLDKDIAAQVEQVSNRLIDAANAALAEGLDDRKRQSLIEAVESVETFADIGSAMMPLAAEESFNPAEEPPPPAEDDQSHMMKFKYDEPPPSFVITLDVAGLDAETPVTVEAAAAPAAMRKVLSTEGPGMTRPKPVAKGDDKAMSQLVASPSFLLEKEKVEVVVVPLDDRKGAGDKKKKDEKEKKENVGVVRRAIRNIEHMLEEFEKSQPEGLLKVLHRRKDRDVDAMFTTPAEGDLSLRKDSKLSLFEEQPRKSVVGELMPSKQSGLRRSSTTSSMEDVIPRPDGMSPEWVNWRRQCLNLSPDNIWNELGVLSFGKEDGKLFVKAGTLNQILIHLTSPLENAADALAGSDFYRTFMMTLQTFTEPEIFVQKMNERYCVPQPPPGVSKEAYEQDVKNPVQMRVCNLLKKWIIARYDQDLAHKPRLLEDLDQFINDVAKDSEYLSKNLRQCFSLYTSGERFLYHKKLAQGDNAHNVMTTTNDASIFHTFAHFDPRDVAEQLTLIDAENFRLYELAGQAWSKKDASVKSPNLMRMINHTNRLSLWVAASIVQEPKLRRRKKIMTNMILLLQYLKSINNFHAVMGVLAGLSMAAVSRLKHTIKELPSRVRKIQEDIEQEMSSLGSFRIYRENIKKATAPVIPFMGVMLSDLTFVEDGNPNMTENGLINWIKRSLLYNILSQFTEYQRVCYYTFPEKRVKDAILASIEQAQTTPSQLYNGSLQIEPRNGELPPESGANSAWSAFFNRRQSVVVTGPGPSK